MTTYDDMWKVPAHFQPDIGIYLGMVLLNFKGNNMEPPNYVDVKRKLIKKYGQEKFEIFKPKIRPMLWKTHRLYEIGYDKGNLRFPGMFNGGRKKRKTTNCRGGKEKSITKRKGRNKKTRRRRGGGRDENVQQAMSDWQPGFDHPDRTLPHHVLRNITGHLQAQEEANPRYGFIRFPSPVLKQTMDKVEEPPPLSYPPPPKLSEEQKNNMIIQQYTSIPDSGKILPMKFIVSENNPRTGAPFKVTYGDAGKIQFLHLKAVGNVPYWDESWLEPKRFHQSFKFPRPAPVLHTPGNRVLDRPPKYDDRRGDILVAIDPSNDKVIVEIGEVTGTPMSCSHLRYTTHCFKIFFKTPKELDFTSGKPDGERRQPYELTLPPQTVIRVIRGRKKDYPPMTPRDSFREPPKGGRKKRKTKKTKKK